MNDLSIRAAQVQLRALIAALIVAIAIAVGITTGAFVLSFAVQRDLALQAGIPHYLTWIFPAIVDGAILGATIAVVALSKIGGSAIGKRFFLGLAVVVVFISVFGNANHAYRAGEAAARNVAAGIELGYTPLSPTGASLIAIIPPLLVLAFTHGVGILIKAIGTAHMEYTAVVRDARHREPQWAGEDAGTDSRMSAPEPRSVDRNTGRNAQSVASTVAPGVDVASATESSASDRARAAVARPDIDRDVAAVLQPEEADPADFTGVAGESEEHQKHSIRNALHSRDAAQEISNGPEGPPQSFVLPDETQTIDNLLAFIDACADFEPIVKETARLRISERRSYAEIATLTNAKAASTAMRRFDKVAQRAVEAGFRTPPLPDVDDSTEGRNAATLDKQYAFAGALQ
ncbi:excisionase (plasmid) [Rhodococcus oxybenzonivorans]|uniref:Excisionase n=1 Tax=Rhodococcus oxybenzonivorans TaxID=1990687 RepID=A0A2S2C6A3_9NOCA|nr:DUF2637 domain-containing protein [Rhodococcus oxybenzonivorans]AWK76431.1 excisionase [Rhodococcus oxybenzonivorans]